MTVLPGGGVVTRGLPDLGRSEVDPVWLKRCHRRWIVRTGATKMLRNLTFWLTYLEHTNGSLPVLFRKPRYYLIFALKDNFCPSLDQYSRSTMTMTNHEYKHCIIRCFINIVCGIFIRFIFLHSNHFIKNKTIFIV